MCNLRHGIGNRCNSKNISCSVKLQPKRANIFNCTGKKIWLKRFLKRQSNSKSQNVIFSSKKHDFPVYLYESIRGQHVSYNVAIMFSLVFFFLCLVCNFSPLYLNRVSHYARYVYIYRFLPRFRFYRSVEHLEVFGKHICIGFFSVAMITRIELERFAFPANTKIHFR